MGVSAQPQDPAAVPLGKRAPSFHWKEGWVSPTANLRHLEEHQNVSFPQPSAHSLAATPTTLSWLPCMTNPDAFYLSALVTLW
jgi:hypothetical protein